jgi:hypothetical protein
MQRIESRYRNFSEKDAKSIRSFNVSLPVPVSTCVIRVFGKLTVMPERAKTDTPSSLCTIIHKAIANWPTPLKVHFYNNTKRL